MTRLLEIENHHSWPGPVLPEGGYLGYLENMHGEQLIFHQAAGEKNAVIWHGDTEYHRHKIEAGQAPDLILSLGERLWVAACWYESSLLRESAPEQTAAEVAAAIMEVTEGFDANQYFAKALVDQVVERMRRERDKQTDGSG